MVAHGFQMSAFSIDISETSILRDPADYREEFDTRSALLFDSIFAPAFLDKMLERAASTNFIDDDVEYIGTREVEAPQRVGAAISLLLQRPAMLDWFEKATGCTPLRAAAGRLVQTRENGRDELAWHDDLGDPTRKLAIVINLSDAPFEGGIFDLRHVGEQASFLSHRHDKAGTMIVFAVRPGLEHRVTMVTKGGPRRVYAGWFLTQPEHESGGIEQAARG